MKKWIKGLAAVLLAGITASTWLSTAAAGEGDAPILTESRHAKWIDRVRLPEYAKEFYDICIEASDNDGYRDYFIEDCYFDLSPCQVEVSFKYLKTLKAGDFVKSHEFTGIFLGAVKGEEKDYALRSVGIAFQGFLHDYPEVFWLDGQWQRWFEDEESHAVYLFFALEDVARASGFRYTGYTQDTIRAAIEKRDRDVAKIVSDLPKGADDGEKAVYFHDVLVENNQYNTLVAEALAAGRPTDDIRAKVPQAWECVSALSGSVGAQGPVCYAYAKAFKVLCDKAGVPCVITNSQDHVWNYVEIGGNWYGVDAMMDDPAAGAGALSGYEGKGYLLVGARTPGPDGRPFLDSHAVENRVWLYPGNGPDLWLVNGPELSEEAYAGVRGR
ncbi:MAG: hypothetical protein HFG61_08865 [Lachnospiraceae bacterium]|nr:hypothetical protein [Lachnospiraceae bacterium]